MDKETESTERVRHVFKATQLGSDQMRTYIQTWRTSREAFI